MIKSHSQEANATCTPNSPSTELALGRSGPKICSTVAAKTGTDQSKERQFLVIREKEIRVVALRSIRYLITAAVVCETLKKLHVEVLVIRYFELEGRTQERIESCKLVKRWMDVDPKSFPKIFVSGLVSLAEDPKDEFRDFALDSLRVLSIVNTKLVAWSSGFRTLVSAILDPKASGTL